MAEAVKGLIASIGMLATAFLAVPLLGSPALAQPTHHPACPPAGAHVIAGNGIVRVYSTEPAKPRFGPRTTEACLVRRGTRMTLVAPRAPAGPGRGLRKSLGEVALSGSIVAYVEGQFGVDSGCDGIVVADVATRRVLRAVPIVGCSIDAGFIRRERVTDLVVGSHGSVAWILERGANSRPKTLLVNAAAVSGPATVLDEGPDIGATSLSLSAGMLSWWHAGVQRTASLPM
jgi:hypothetical protein